MLLQQESKCYTFKACSWCYILLILQVENVSVGFVDFPLAYEAFFYNVPVAYSRVYGFITNSRDQHFCKAYLLSYPLPPSARFVRSRQG